MQSDHFDEQKANMLKPDTKRFDWLTIGIGVAILAIVVQSAWLDVRFYLNSRVAIGEVVRLNHGGHHPQVEFNTADGQTIRFPAGSAHPVDVGDRLEVRYLPGNPRAGVRLNEDTGTTLLRDGVPVAVALAFIVLGMMGKSVFKYRTKQDDE